jgi:hypothetical protein
MRGRFSKGGSTFEAKKGLNLHNYHSCVWWLEYASCFLYVVYSKSRMRRLILPLSVFLVELH